jgi:hypothetical protein
MFLTKIQNAPEHRPVAYKKMLLYIGRYSTSKCSCIGLVAYIKMLLYMDR